MTIDVHIHDAPDIDSASADYARRFAGPIGEYFLQVQSRHVLDLVAPWPRAKVLDVGGGHGQLAVPLVKAGYDVTVTGSTWDCRRSLDEQLDPEQFSFCVCPLLELPYEDRAFDIVLAFRLLPHLAHWSAFLRELCRVARHTVIVDYPEQSSVNRFSQSFFAAKKALEGNTRPYRCFAQKELARCFDLEGFIHLDRRPQYFFPMVVHRALKRPVVSRGFEAVAAGMGLTHWFGSPVILRARRAENHRDFVESEGSS